MNRVAFSGRIISVNVPSFKTRKSVLDFLISVNTGQPRTDEYGYKPSFLVKFLIWDRLAEVLKQKAEKDDIVVVDGRLGVPTVYTDKNGETQVILNLYQVDSIEICSRKETDPLVPTAPTRKSTAPSKGSASKVSPKKDIPDWDLLDDGDADEVDWPEYEDDSLPL